MATTEWTVLLVEDEFDSLQMVSKILKHHGINVHIAKNGRECLEVLENLEPRAVVMDLAMPEMDGWATLVEMRANPGTAHIPVIAITAYHSADVARDARQAGFDAYFPKPLNPVSFVDDLSHIIGAS